MTSSQLTAHIETLCARHSITIDWRDSTRGRSWRKGRSIRVQRIKPLSRSMDALYAVALHEIGHIVGDYPKLRIDKEVAAWDWAKAHAIHWTPPMRERAAAALQSYVNRSYRHKTMRIPGVGHRVFAYIEGRV